MSPREEGNVVASVVGHAGAGCVRSSEKGSSLHTCHCKCVMCWLGRIFLSIDDVEESCQRTDASQPSNKP